MRDYSESITLLMMNLINMDRTQGELTRLTFKVLLDSRGAYKPHTHKVNLLIRLTTIEHFFC